jgi:hypothetical protein
MENLYNYEEAAELIGLSGRSSVRSRIKALADRGKPLTVEAGEFYAIGKRLLLTDIGLARLREFEPLPAGRPPGAVGKLSHVLV